VKPHTQARDWSDAELATLREVFAMVGAERLA
jgi:hypothetical protein